MAGSTTKSRRRLVALLVGLPMLVLSLLLAIWLLWPNAHRSIRGRARAAVARVSVVAGATPSTPNARTDDTGSPAVAKSTVTIRCPTPPGVGTVSVLVESQGPPETMWTALGQDGWFDLAVSQASGEGTIKIEGFAHASFRWDDAHERGHGTCTVTEPWSPRDRGLVVGHVVVPGDGELPEGTTVEGCGSFSNAKVGADGEFRLEAMSKGPCDLNASYRRGNLTVEGESLRIDPDEPLTDIELPMEPYQVVVRGFLGSGAGTGVPRRTVVLNLEPDGLRVRYALTSDLRVVQDPPSGMLITSVEGVSTATTADAQVELADRLLHAGTSYTSE